MKAAATSSLISASIRPRASSWPPRALILALKDAITQKSVTQTEAARLCGTDQPTLSKVLRGRMESVTIDRLASWLTALARNVEIVVPPAAQPHSGHLHLREAA